MDPFAVSPVGRNRALAFWNRNVARVSKGTDWEKGKRKAIPGGVVKSVVFTTVENELVLALMDYQGRILQRSGPHPELAGEATAYLGMRL